MPTKKETVYGLMKPKTASLGFTKDELMTVCENIAGRFDSKEEEATEEEINAEIDAVLPFLQMSQSAANRIVQQSKSQKKEPKKAGKKNKKSKSEEDDDDDDDDDHHDSDDDDDDDVDDDTPKWARKLIKDNQSLREELSSMKAEKTHDGLIAGVKTSLKDIDEGFYSMALNGRKFATQEEADQFVTDVKDNYKSFAKKMNIKSLAELTPPKGGKKDENEPSEEAKARAEARKAQQTAAPIMGLPQQK